MLSNFKKDTSHQEIERILSEIEEFYESVNLTKQFNDGDEDENKEQMWVKTDSAELFLIATLGYDDKDGIEDAMGGSVSMFLEGLPNCETKTDEEGNVLFRFQAKVQEPPRTLRFKVTKREHLWVTFLKDSAATCEIPEIEFESYADDKRKIDSIYNYVALIVQHLEDHVIQLQRQGGANPMVIDGINSQIQDLKNCLDLNMEWTLLVHDYRGLSEFKTSDGSDVTQLVDVLPVGTGGSADQEVKSSGGAEELD